MPLLFSRVLFSLRALGEDDSCLSLNEIYIPSMPATSFHHSWWCLTPSFPLITSLHLLSCTVIVHWLHHTGDWLNGVPSSARGLDLQDCEFHCCLCYWLGVPLYNDHYTSLECFYTSKMYRDYQLSCGTNGDQVSWHNTIQNATCVDQSWTVAPSKESLQSSDQLSCMAKWHLSPTWVIVIMLFWNLHAISPYQQQTLKETVSNPGQVLQVGLLSSPSLTGP